MVNDVDWAILVRLLEDKPVWYDHRAVLVSWLFAHPSCVRGVGSTL
jgi:hypothetical protein